LGTILSWPTGKPRRQGRPKVRYHGRTPQIPLPTTPFYASAPIGLLEAGENIVQSRIGISTLLQGTDGDAAKTHRNEPLNMRNHRNAISSRSRPRRVSSRIREDLGRRGRPSRSRRLATFGLVIAAANFSQRCSSTSDHGFCRPAPFDKMRDFAGVQSASAPTPDP
jgi:hypothetical protein